MNGLPEIDGDLLVGRLVELLRTVVRESVPQAQEWADDIKIFYKGRALFCYIWPLPRVVNFGFHRGGELDDPQGILYPGKVQRQVRLSRPAQVDPLAFTALVLQAWELDQKGPPAARKTQTTS